LSLFTVIIDDEGGDGESDNEDAQDEDSEGHTNHDG
jgi:hypothetical protein